MNDAEEQIAGGVRTAPPTSAARVILSPRRAKPFYARHPWVYAGAIERVEGNPVDGDVVDLYSHGDHFIARGLCNSQSKIRVRLYIWQTDVALDAHFFRERIAAALRLREMLPDWNKPAGPYRLISCPPPCPSRPPVHS